MIKVDISNIWGEVSLPDLLGLEKEIFDAHNALTEGTGAGCEYTGWLNLPMQQESEEILRIHVLQSEFVLTPMFLWSSASAAVT